MCTCFLGVHCDFGGLGDVMHIHEGDGQALLAWEYTVMDY
jgi:hypothetical protein